mgnify:CR=1 FL=1
MVTLRRKEIYRYLGFRNTQPPEDIVQRVEICVEEMERAAVFRTTYKRFPVTITAPNTVETAGRFTPNICIRTLAAATMYTFLPLQSASASTASLSGAKWAA